MDITLCENLKELRKKRGNTQADLAVFLKVSNQAISKWERGDGYPDITLLPSIASYYDVSVDTILGVDKINKMKKMQEYIMESQSLSNNGKTSECVTLWRKAYNEFPNDLQVINNLMYALAVVNRKENAAEVILYGERIIKESLDNKLKSGAIQILCYTYKAIGKIEEAKKYASMSDTYATSANTLMISLLEGEEAVKYCQYNIAYMIDLISLNVIHIINSGKLNSEDIIKAGILVLNLFRLLYVNGDYGFYNCRIANWYYRLAKAYVNNNIDSVFENLEKAVTHCIKYDTEGKSKHTSLMVNRLEYIPENTSKNHTNNQSALLLDKLKNNLFDTIREDERFKKIVADLSSTAK